MLVGIFVWAYNSFWIPMDDFFENMLNKIISIFDANEYIELDDEKWQAYEG